MKKVLWITVGIGVGIIITVKAKEILHRFTPEGAGEYLEEKAQSVKGSFQHQLLQFNADRKAREEQLRETLFADPETDTQN